MMSGLRMFICSLLLLAAHGCKPSQRSIAVVPMTGTFKVAVLYPGGEGKTFDMDYYEQTHMPMMAGLLGKNLRFYEIDKGIAGRAPGDRVPFVAIGYFYVNDVAEYNKAIMEHIDAVRSDVQRYTNIQPTVQISEIRRVVPGKAN